MLAGGPRDVEAAVGGGRAVTVVIEAPGSP